MGQLQDEEKVEEFFREPEIGWWLIATVLLVAVSVMLLVLATPARAHVLTPDECTGFARDALYFAEKRDTGMTWEKAELALVPSMAIATIQPGSYLRDGEDTQMLQLAAQQIFAVKDSPGQLYDRTRDLCLKRYYGNGGS